MLALRPIAKEAQKSTAPTPPQAQGKRPPVPHGQTSSSQNRVMTVSTNILPCRIHHDGPVDVSSRHWNPVLEKTAEGDTAIAYFRGRKLLGRCVSLPDGHQGVVVAQPSKSETTTRRMGEGKDEEDEEEPLTQLETVGTFSAITIWDHEKLPVDEDAYIRSMQEWVDFAHAMHVKDEEKGPIKT